MPTLVRRNDGTLYRDPFTLARDVLGFVPFGTYERTPPRAAEARFAPAFEVAERADAYLVTADLPGVQQADLDVTVQDGNLVVRGSRRTDERREGDRFVLSERRYGEFARTFKLPDDADDGAIEASLDDGVLRLQIGKRAAAKPRKISLGQRLKDSLGMH